jgi:hypothetical protein
MGITPGGRRGSGVGCFAICAVRRGAPARTAAAPASARNFFIEFSL